MNWIKDYEIKEYKYGNLINWFCLLPIWLNYNDSECIIVLFGEMETLLLELVNLMGDGKLLLSKKIVLVLRAYLTKDGFRELPLTSFSLNGVLVSAVDSLGNS